MGRDKAFVEVDGEPLVLSVCRALRSGGAQRVGAVGGDSEALRRLGIVSWLDRWPGQGPMSGIVSVARGTRAHPAGILVAASCDLPALRGDGVASLVEDLRSDEGADAAIPVVDGIWQSHLVAFRFRGLERLAEAFDAGKRSLWRTLSAMDGVIESSVVDPGQLVDLDSPADVADYARRSRPPVEPSPG